MRAAGQVTPFVTCLQMKCIKSKKVKYAGGRIRTCVGTKPIDDLHRV